MKITNEVSFHDCLKTSLNDNIAIESWRLKIDKISLTIEKREQVRSRVVVLIFSNIYRGEIRNLK